jgi:hypothetical protein
MSSLILDPSRQSTPARSNLRVLERNAQPDIDTTMPLDAVEISAMRQSDRAFSFVPPLIFVGVLTAISLAYMIFLGEGEIARNLLVPLLGSESVLIGSMIGLYKYASDRVDRHRATRRLLLEIDDCMPRKSYTLETIAHLILDKQRHKGGRVPFLKKPLD